MSVLIIAAKVHSVDVAEFVAKVFVNLSHGQLRECQLSDLSMSHVHQIGFGSVFAKALNSWEDHLDSVVFDATFHLWCLVLEIGLLDFIRIVEASNKQKCD